MTYLMEIDNLGKRYDDFELSGVSLAVEPGCVVGFIGSNGAGKTTTIKAALGIIAADEGAVRLFGQPIACGSPELDTIKSRIGVVLDTCASPTPAAWAMWALSGGQPTANGTPSSSPRCATASTWPRKRRWASSRAAWA